MASRQAHYEATVHVMGPSSIARLPVELLAQVLQHLHVQEALKCSLVNSNWHAAAVLAVDKIDIFNCNQRKADALQAYLCAHAHAPVGRIKIIGGHEAPCVLQLPTAQLTCLQDLTLAYLDVSSCNSPAAPTAAGSLYSAGSPFLRPLTALTRLEWDARDAIKAGSFEGLADLRGLQQLEIDSEASQAKIPDSTIAVLAAAMPCLRQLTGLKLNGQVCESSLPSQLSGLTKLQRLALQDINAEVGTYQGALDSLPTSLTDLFVDVGDILYSPSSTPGLCPLTKLRELHVRPHEGRGQFDVAVLAQLTGLHKLWLGPVQAADNELQLAVLTGLTQLQLLDLQFMPHDDATVLVEDHAALTSSQQLTILCVSGLGDDMGQVFPATRQLPNLICFQGAMGWLSETGDIRGLVCCCPNLRSLHLVYCEGIELIEAEVCQQSLQCVASLSRLTLLSLDCSELVMEPGVWRALAALTGLQRLHLSGVHEVDMVSLVHLTTCHHMTQLTGSVVTLDNERVDVFRLINMAPAGRPSDLWCHLPCYILQAVLARLDVFATYPQGLREVLRAALAITRSALSTQKQLQHQVAQLQDSMAAVLTHLGLPAP